MSDQGQTRPGGGVGSMSGLPPKAAVERTSVGCLKGAIPVMAAIRGTGVTEYWIELSPQSALMLAVRITFAHLCVSSATNFPKSEGESIRGTMPRSVYRALIAGLARPALI
jgi:hypothetical protein